MILATLYLLNILNTIYNIYPLPLIMIIDLTTNSWCSTNVRSYAIGLPTPQYILDGGEVI